MKTEKEINARIRDLFERSTAGYGYDNDDKMKEVAVLHWVIDDKAIYKEIKKERKYFKK